jgi:hypothetical protein
MSEPIEAEVVEPGVELARVEPPTVSPEALIQRAIDAQVPVETMEKLLDMRRVLKEESARDEFFLAMSSFQDECPSIEKQTVADTGKYKYKFAPFDHIVSVIRPFLKKHDFYFSFDSSYKTTPALVQEVVCTLHHKRGHSETSTFTSPIDNRAAMSDPQKSAAALTFGKRYALCDVLGLTVGQDIDGYVPPEQHGSPSDNASAPAATTRNQQREVSATEAKNLYLDWRTYHRQIEADASDDAWLAWFVEATGMPDNIARNSAVWSAADFSTACHKFNEMAPGLRNE